MELKELQRNWNAFGETDPLGAILTEPDKVGGNWEKGEFFGRGIDEIDQVMDYVWSLGLTPRRGRALDFGCGVGRLTQALCRYFDRCHGVDIAPSMIQLAHAYNRFGPRCRYHLNAVDDLSLFPDGHFDFIYSNIVLQHMRTEYSRNYIKEFIRILASGGLAIFQLPSTRPDPGLQPQPLPDSALRASITPIDPPARLAAGSKAAMRVRVKNVGGSTWPCIWDSKGRYNVTIGNRWLDEAGGIAVPDDGRIGLPRDLKPGDEAEMPLTVTAPGAPGRYTLAIDAIQEAHIWFHQKGSPLALSPVVVVEAEGPRPSPAPNRDEPARTPEPSAPSQSSDEPGPVMEMYGIERPEVEAMIRQLGGRVIDTTITPTFDWIHARYCLTK